MIKNILFDFGGVIITLSPDEAVRRFAALGLKDADRALDSYTQSGIFGALERGEISDEEFRVKLSEMVGHELTWAECQHAWHGYHKVLPQRNLDALRKLRSEGYRIILTSNTNPYMMDWAMSDKFDGKGNPLSHYMDALYMSFKMGVMKPAEEYFRIVLDGENINPDETLFVDDGPRNIESAARLGIHTFLATNGEDWTEEIYNYLKEK